MFLPGFEPGTFRVSGERDNHYTTETTSDATLVPPSIELSPPSSIVGSEPGDRLTHRHSTLGIHRNHREDAQSQ